MLCLNHSFGSIDQAGRKGHSLRGVCVVLQGREHCIICTQRWKLCHICKFSNALSQMYPFQVSDSLPPQLGLGWSQSIKLSLELSYPSNYILYLILCLILP